MLFTVQKVKTLYVVTIDQNQNIELAARIMIRYNISSVIVIEGNDIVDILIERTLRDD
ncbi:hypothetical protein HOJ44_06860 [Candidatus Bathyarchaeota archaeon]|jgi:CBS domain-containing protein|nr:hypothetical protein [Candidatus Bathyarchaeota archaeon]MBT5642821.1 hypothetical protein [Candidatus Bathyarchaeota archaeon]MBT7186329.1 hypothetical protein [Candidatus Bathyarchaeota archaeon]MBT7915669.1 hypothetical protein [Candidatus Bathyarchaeota archaeon]